MAPMPKLVSATGPRTLFNLCSLFISSSRSASGFFLKLFFKGIMGLTRLKRIIKKRRMTGSANAFSMASYTV